MREREGQRHRERERQRHTQRETETQRERETDKQRDLKRFERLGLWTLTITPQFAGLPAAVCVSQPKYESSPKQTHIHVALNHTNYLSVSEPAKMKETMTRSSIIESIDKPKYRYSQLNQRNQPTTFMYPSSCQPVVINNRLTVINLSTDPCKQSSQNIYLLDFIFILSG